MRYGPTDREWETIKSMLPNKPRGVARVDDRRVLNGIFWVLRSGAWRDPPDRFGPYLLQSLRSLATGRRQGKIMNALGGLRIRRLALTTGKTCENRESPI